MCRGTTEFATNVDYVTLCGGGLITRMVVADVSGHGSSVAEFSSSLRSLLRMGEVGLLAVASELDLATSSPAAVGSALQLAVACHRGPASADDDVTMIVLRHNATGRRRLSVAQKVEVYAKVFGLKPV